MKFVKFFGFMLVGLAFWSSLAWADDFVRGVYPATPPSSFTLYAFDPELLGAWDTPLYEYEKKFIPEKYQKLPILGGWYGQGFTPDREMLMASGLKKAFILENNFFSVERIQAALASMGLTLLSAPDGLEKTPQTFRAMGQIFNRSTRGEELAIWAEKALESLKILKSLPNERKPRVYFAMDADGLASSCQGEARSIFIDFAGGRNCLTCADALKPGRPRISFEELMAMDPDTILVESVELLKVINQSPHWARLRAKKEGRVYLVPRGPFSWNGHPTLTALMGARWLANLLHPDLYPLDVVAEAKEFNRLFFRLELTDQEVRELLGQNLAS